MQSDKAVDQLSAWCVLVRWFEIYEWSAVVLISCFQEMADGVASEVGPEDDHESANERTASAAHWV